MALETADRDWRTRLESRLRRLESLVSGSVVRPWSPSLTATTTSPTLGTGGYTDGIYYRTGGVCHFIANIRFGTAGAAAGSGTYQIEGLPYLPYERLATLTFLIEGRARLRDASVPSLNPVATLLLGDDGILTIRRPSTIDGGADNLVTATSPWTWAINDRIEVAGSYLLR